MHDILARAGLLAVENARIAAGRRIAKDPRCISRASVARAGGMNDVQIWKGLSGGAVTRVLTVAKAAGGLLTRIIQETSEEDFSVPETFEGRVMGAAHALALAVGVSVGTPKDAAARKRVADKAAALDKLLHRTVSDHHRVAKGLNHLAAAWLADLDNHGLRLAVTGAAIAIVNATTPEAAHV